MNNNTKKTFDVKMDLKSIVSVQIEGDNKNTAVQDAHTTLGEILTYLVPEQEYKLPNGKVVKLKVHHNEIEPYASAVEEEK